MAYSEGTVRKLAWIVEKDISEKKASSPSRGGLRKGLFPGKKQVPDRDGKSKNNEFDTDSATSSSYSPSTGDTLASSPRSTSTVTTYVNRSPTLQEVEDESFSYTQKAPLVGSFTSDDECDAETISMIEDSESISPDMHKSFNGDLISIIERNIDRLVRKQDEGHSDDGDSIVYDELIRNAPLTRKRSIDTVVTTGYFHDKFVEKNASSLPRIVNININNVGEFFSFFLNNLRLSNFKSWQFWRNIALGFFNIIKHSNYINTSHNNKLHLQSFIFGVVSTNITFLIKPLMYRYVNFWIQLLFKILKHVFVWLTVVGAIYLAYKVYMNSEAFAKANAQKTKSYSSVTREMSSSKGRDRSANGIEEGSRPGFANFTPQKISPGFLVPDRSNVNNKGYYEHQSPGRHTMKPEMKPKPSRQREQPNVASKPGNIAKKMTPDELRLLRALAAKKLGMSEKSHLTTPSEKYQEHSSPDSRIRLRHNDSIPSKYKITSPKQKEYSGFENPYNDTNSTKFNIEKTNAINSHRHSGQFQTPKITPRPHLRLMSPKRTPSPSSPTHNQHPVPRNLDMQHTVQKGNDYTNVNTVGSKKEIRRPRPGGERELNHFTPGPGNNLSRSRSPVCLRNSADMQSVKSMSNSSIDINSFNMDSDSIISNPQSLKGAASRSVTTLSIRFNASDDSSYNAFVNRPSLRGSNNSDDNVSVTTSSSNYTKFSGISGLSTNTENSLKSSTTTGGYSVDSRNGALVGADKNNYNKFMRNVTGSVGENVSRSRKIFE